MLNGGKARSPATAAAAAARERERRLNKALSLQSGTVREKDQEAGAHE